MLHSTYSDTSASTCRFWDDGSHFQSRSSFLGSKLPESESVLHAFQLSTSFTFQRLFRCQLETFQCYQGTESTRKVTVRQAMAVGGAEGSVMHGLDTDTTIFSGQSFHLDNTTWRVKGVLMKGGRDTPSFASTKWSAIIDATSWNKPSQKWKS